MAGIRTLEIFLLPLALLCISIIMQAGALGSGGTSTQIDCQANINICKSATNPATIHCNNNLLGLPCNITTAINAASAAISGPQYCQTGNFFNNGILTYTPAPPQPAYCVTNQVILPAGSTVKVVGETGTGVFGIIIQALGSDGFVAVLLTVGGVVVLSALNLFSTGENATGTRIFFFVTMALALWGMLAATESGLSANGGFFTWMNGLIPNLGTSTFIVLTLFYVGGTMGLISGNIGE